MFLSQYKSTIIFSLSHNGNYETKVVAYILFNTDKITTFTICVLPSDTASNDVASCLNSPIKQTFTGRLKPTFSQMKEATIAGKSTFSIDLDGAKVTDIINAVPFVMPVSTVNYLGDSIIYITSDKQGADLLPLSLSDDKLNYKNDDVKDLFKTDGHTTHFMLCTFLKGVTTATKTACQVEVDDGSLGKGFFAIAT